jgi:plastocyanin
VVRVVNADTVPHALALFTAAPGSTMDYTISTPGTYGGTCSTHPSGNLVYVVR